MCYNMEWEKVKIRTPDIGLAAFLKWAGVVETGGQAKRLVTTGKVKVNGRVETRRNCKVVPGDKVEALGRCYEIVSE